MIDPSDLVPALVRYGNIALDYLRKHLTEEQIDSYLSFLHSDTTTHGEAYRFITEEKGHSETIFYALDSFGRINAMCEAATCPSEEPQAPEKVFIVAFAALRAGMTLGAIVDDEGRQAIMNMAKHGMKFKSTGKHNDELTHHLVSLFQSFHVSKGRYPRNKEVLQLLEMEQGQGFIHSVTDEVIEWGDEGRETQVSSLPNRLTKVRNMLGIKKSR